MNIIRYAIADDHKIFRQGLKLVLNDDPGLECIGEAQSGVELLELLKRQEPDIVLLDLKMPDMDGFAATKAIKADFPSVKIIILTMHNEESFILHLMELGANGYLIKNAESEEIINAIHAVHETNYYFNNLVSQAMLRKIAINKRYNPAVYSRVDLNDRETQVLRLICEEKTAAEIGAIMFLSPRTIEGIRAGLQEKTKARNIAGLVLYAVKNGIVN